MSRYELRWAWRHPLQWARVWWIHLIVAFTFGGLSAAWGQEIFLQVFPPVFWPLAMSWVGGLVVATALAPFALRLNAVTGAAMITLGVLRVAALAEVYYIGTASRPVVFTLMMHALLIAVLGFIWPTWTRACGARATVEAGEDDRGHGGEGC